MSQISQQNATRGQRHYDVGTVLARAKRLCRQVAGRDLGNAPLYIVPQSQLPNFAYSNPCNGYTSRSLDLYLQGAIGASWRGRGPCMVINDLRLAEDCHVDDFEYLALAIALHELAHILERPRLVTERVGVTPAQIQFEALVIAEAVVKDPPPEQPAYQGHESSFIRLALHLCHRAAERGVQIAPPIVCGGWPYGLSPAFRYVEALGDEAARLADLSFRDILAISPPQDFAQLWVDDVFAYDRRYSL